MHSLEWDDLRIVLTVARDGSLSAAARTLGVTHSTVFRRLNEIEARVGVRLFDRFRDGYSPTSAGEAMAAVAARVGDEIAEIERRLSGQDLRPSGNVRVTTTDTIGALLIRHLPGLRRAHPGIHLEIAISNAVSNLGRREADIALRPTSRPQPMLIGRKIAGIAHAIYGSREYLAKHKAKALAAQDWIGLDEGLNDTVIGEWMRKNVPEDRCSCHVDALPALRDAACAGLGLALLPCYVGDTTPDLRRVVQKPLVEPRSALWLLTHADLRRTARIRATMDFLATALGRDRGLFEGTTTGAKKSGGSTGSKRAPRD